MKTIIAHCNKPWNQYNQSLINRGRLNIWIDENITDWWYGHGKHTYSDQCIELILTLKAVYNLPLRATIGFIQSILEYNGIFVSVPDYSTVSRRAKRLVIPLRKKSKKQVSLLIDSTGLKVFGEGEWKVRKHGYSKRRTWKKLHVCIDTDFEIRSVCMSHSSRYDGIMIDDLLNQEQGNITEFYGDGAYDTNPVYMSLAGRCVNEVYIPPRKNSVLTERTHPYKQQNMQIPRDVWKKQTKYHKRSLVETHMFRHKQLLSPYLSFRNDKAQQTEVMIKCNILNKLLEI